MRWREEEANRQIHLLPTLPGRVWWVLSALNHQVLPVRIPPAVDGMSGVLRSLEQERAFGVGLGEMHRP